MKSPADEEKPIRPEQSRAARAMLGMGVVDLAQAARVSSNTVTRMERGEKLGQRTLEAIQGALEKAGCMFLNDEHGTGVLLKPKIARQRQKKDSAE